MKQVFHEYRLFGEKRNDSPALEVIAFKPDGASEALMPAVVVLRIIHAERYGDESTDHSMNYPSFTSAAKLTREAIIWFDSMVEQHEKGNILYPGQVQ